MRVNVLVSVEMPSGAEPHEIVEYVQDAVAGWAGCLNPDEDPMFDLDRDLVHYFILDRKDILVLKDCVKGGAAEFEEILDGTP